MRRPPVGTITRIQDGKPFFGPDESEQIFTKKWLDHIHDLQRRQPHPDPAKSTGSTLFAWSLEFFTLALPYLLQFNLQSTRLGTSGINPPSGPPAEPVGPYYQATHTMPIDWMDYTRDDIEKTVKQLREIETGRDRDAVTARENWQYMEPEVRHMGWKLVRDVEAAKESGVWDLLSGGLEELDRVMEQLERKGVEVKKCHTNKGDVYGAK